MSREDPSGARRWLLTLTRLGFILLQSACTAIMAISGIRLVIGLGALAAASGVAGTAQGFHRDAIRIPMMMIAVLGSLCNELHAEWSARCLREPARWHGYFEHLVVHDQCGWNDHSHYAEPSHLR